MGGLPIWAAALFIWGAFFPVVMILDPVKVYHFVGCIAFTSGAAVLHAFSPDIRKIVFKRSREADYVDMLTLGILCVFAAVTFRAGFVTWLNWVDPVPASRPADVFLPLSFFRYMAFTGSLLHISARPVHIFGRMHTGWPRVAIALSAGVTLYALSVLTS